MQLLHLRAPVPITNGERDGEARQPSHLAPTFHLWNTSAGLDQRLQRNELPGLSSEEKVANASTHVDG